MRTLDEVKTMEDAQQVYYDAVRNLRVEDVQDLEMHPVVSAGDGPLITHAKRAYARLQEFGHGVIDVRCLPLRPLAA